MDNILTIAYINAVGQSGLSRDKQAQVKSFLFREKVNILNLQEIYINEDSFSLCPLMSS